MSDSISWSPPPEINSMDRAGCSGVGVGGEGDGCMCATVLRRLAAASDTMRRQR
ncbi:hypothetical protein EMIHUDRAFT_369097 [Emiliania huxleyi CCMP1516]|uniref:Uncharacterized protein n=2 Tax=Emiliania huxleyi TaxID=2903 RepID=A0A0D3JAW0_EMIH1|nr:hypothetical protein EMIHUDRAFT_358042 [Emiliania huxleyi CCMP1516]XP_005773074.1 hypothetical protein EMIHUDRAFT_369097 [Emiliania huxleyi CCMP1516]EOD10940.1 hypothetical protein EMIHUDRAFT_358042 [Emiliania huxleyi CCMP1516]EOD20645.1 hypothetical protein EMIHUDRAFT_369097 [Emiliania huxleyi CCMP1516]|eukprot:XP_005763369.1 hypothetical protein EMIHUDRAFT_358042 [Emiliania huxleyi CCMP1516]